MSKKSFFYLIPGIFFEELFFDGFHSSSYRMCTWHDAQAKLLVVAGSHKALAVTGRKGNANPAWSGTRAASRNGASEGSMRQNPCT